LGVPETTPTKLFHVAGRKASTMTWYMSWAPSPNNVGGQKIQNL